VRAFAASDEPGYDPTDDIIARIDAARPKPVPVGPLAFLADLLEAGTLTQDQHDAGMIIQGLAAARRIGASYSWRNHAGIWSKVTPRNRGEAELRLNDWLAAVATPRRRKALVQVCVAENPVQPDIDQFVAGLDDLVARFWPAVQPYVDGRGIKLPGVTIQQRPVGENDATPERLAHANDNYVTPGGVRVVKTTAFEMLHGRGQLDRDSKLNELLYAAGVRYQSDYHQAMMAPLKAVDYDRQRVDGGKGFVYSERTQRHRVSLEEARVAMGDRYRAIVDAIVLEGQSLIAFGMTASVFKHRHQITAQMGERLNAGLRRLAVHYRLIKE
jgi:hypothetical protein